LPLRLGIPGRAHAPNAAGDRRGGADRLHNAACDRRCNHTPEPGVDWSNCDKTKLMLRNEDLRNAILTGPISAAPIWPAAI
jgi:hypothetical protein